MFNLLRKLVWRKTGVEQARGALMEEIREATWQGSCVILSKTSEGTRVIVIGKPLALRQADDILRERG